MTSSFQPLAALIAQAVSELKPCLRVASPGSRNAPLIEAFAELPGDEIVVLDERSAAHIALGAAIRRMHPAVAYCTSGTAGMNYGPAVAEAFYQRIPLLVITADRPKHLIDQGHGQSIRQEGLFTAHVRGQANLDPSLTLAENMRLLQHALLGLEEGPVHINVPFEEPLYGRPSLPQEFQTEFGPSPVKAPLELILPEWLKESHRPLLIIGQWNPAWGSALRLVEQLRSKGWLIAAEHLSNLPAKLALNLEDAWVHAPAARVDAIVSLGGAWIAKESKKRLAGTPHWHIGPSAPHPDLFGSLKESSEMRPYEALKALALISPSFEPSWARIWVQQRAYPCQNWSDLWAHEFIAQHAPEGMDVHWANSTSVRYGVHTWSHGGWVGDYAHFANRGASGIDGCSATALGSAIVSNRPSLMMTGELAFFYDANGMLHDEIPPGLKVIIFNNSGGNIFQWLKGPKESARLDSHYRWGHGRSSEHLAAHLGLPYRAVHQSQDLEEGCAWLWSQPEASILELFTDPNQSEQSWKQRFQP